jgi:polar amino acid transport system substrate-binding protein
MRPAMARLIGFRGLLCIPIAVVWALSGRAAPAEPLRLVTYLLPPFSNLHNHDAPGFSVEVIGQVFAAMGREATFEEFPLTRGWSIVIHGERDGMFVTLPTSARAPFCNFADEPLSQERWVLFVRTTDVGRLKFSSFDDLVGHDIAVAGLYRWPELGKLLREHPDNFVEASDPPMTFRMLAAGRVDYAMANLAVGIQEIAEMGLSGKIEPLLSRSVKEDGYRVCFTKARIDPAFVDAFSRALRKFKQTEAFQAIYRKYFP